MTQGQLDYSSQRPWRWRCFLCFSILFPFFLFYSLQLPGCGDIHLKNVPSGISTQVRASIRLHLQRGRGTFRRVFLVLFPHGIAPETGTDSGSAPRFHPRTCLGPFRICPNAEFHISLRRSSLSPPQVGKEEDKSAGQDKLLWRRVDAGTQRGPCQEPTERPSSSQSKTGDWGERICHR